MDGLWHQVGERLRGSIEALITGVEFQGRRIDEVERRIETLEKTQAQQPGRPDGGEKEI